MVGRLLSFWGGLFSWAMLVLGSVYQYATISWGKWWNDMNWCEMEDVKVPPGWIFLLLVLRARLLVVLRLAISGGSTCGRIDQPKGDWLAAHLAWWLQKTQRWVAFQARERPQQPAFGVAKICQEMTYDNTCQFSNVSVSWTHLKICIFPMPLQACSKNWNALVLEQRPLQFSWPTGIKQLEEPKQQNLSISSLTSLSAIWAFCTLSLSVRSSLSSNPAYGFPILEIQALKAKEAATCRSDDKVYISKCHVLHWV